MSNKPAHYNQRQADEMNAKSLKALVASNDTNRSQTYQDVDSIRSRAGLAPVGTENVIEATPEMEAEVNAQFPIEEPKQNKPARTVPEEEPEGVIESEPLPEQAEEVPEAPIDTASLLGEVKSIRKRREVEKAAKEKRTLMGQAEATATAIPRAALEMTAGSLRGIDELSRPSETVEEGSLYQMGEALSDYAGREFEIKPEYEGTVATDIGSGVGSLAGFMATGMVGGTVGRTTAGFIAKNAPREAKELKDIQDMAARSFAVDEGQSLGQTVSAGMMAAPLGADEAYQRAKEFGIEDSAELQQLAEQGVLPGLVQIANINALLKPLSRLERNKTMSSAMTRLRDDAGSEAVLEGAGATGQNNIAQAYNPETGLFDGVAYQALMGAASAAVVQGGRAAVGPAVNAVGRGVKATGKALGGLKSKGQDKSNEINAALDSGDYKTLTNPESFKDTAPDQVAVEVFRRANAEGASPESQKESGKILADLRSNMRTEAERLEQSLDSGEELKGLKRDEKEAKREIAAANRAGNANKAEQWSNHLAVVQESMAELGNTEGARAGKKRLKTLQDQMEVVDRALGDLDNEVIASKDRVDAVTDIASDSAQDRGARTAAAKEMTVIGQINPDNIDADVAGRLAEDNTLDLEESERAFLRSLTKANQSRNRAKSLSGVSQDIFGQRASEGFKSLNEYRANVSDALRAGNKERAESELQGLRDFAQSHRRKADMARKAMRSDVRKGKQVQLVSRGNGQWEQVDGFTFTDEKLKENGGISLSTGSDPLVEAISAEASAITDTGMELASAIELNNRESTPEAETTETAEQSEPVNEPTQETADAPIAEETVNETEQTQSDQSTEEVATPETPTEAEPETRADTATDAEPTREDPEVRDGADGNTRDSGTTVEGSREGNESGQPVEPEQTPEVADATEGESASTETEAETALVKPEKTQPKGMLQVFLKKKDELPGEFADRFRDASGAIAKGAFSGINLVRQFLTQSAKSGNATTERPLVAHKDFLSDLADDPELALEYVDARRYADQANNELTLDQIDAIQHFTEVAIPWNASLDSDLIKKDRTQEYSYQDLLQQLRELSPEATEENLLTAISYAAYSLAKDEAAKPMLNTKEGINAILHRERDHPVTPDEQAVIGPAGDYEGLTINAAGQKAVQVLGIKADKNTPQNLMSQLETSLGSYAVELMVREGVLERHGVTHPSLGQSEGQAKSGNGHQFIRLQRDAKNQPNAVAKKIHEVNMGTGSVLDHLFGVEAAFKEPTFIKPTFNQKTIKGGMQNVPKRQQEIEQIKAERGFVVRENMMVAYDNLQEVMGRIVGQISVEDRLVQQENVMAIQGYNDGLQREIDFLKDFVSNPENRGRPFYLVGDVWKQQRVGLKSNTINPQTSKHHRHLIAMADWEVSIDTDRNSESNRMYRMNLATGLGVDTDKQQIGTSLRALEDTLQKPEFKAAIKALTKIWREPQAGLTPLEQGAVAQAIDMAGEKTHSLDALMGVVQMQEAKGDSFVTDMLLEIDGVTNGPMLSQLQLGAAPSAADLNTLLNKGGFYELGSEYSNFPKWKEEAGENDLYQTVAERVSQNIRAMLQEKPFVRETLEHMNFFMKGLLEPDGTTRIGRNSIKTPINSVTYGSAMGSAVDGMRQEFVQNIYDSIEDAINSSDTRALKNTLNRLNGIMMGITKPEDRAGLTVDANMTAGQAQTLKLSDKQMKAVNKAFQLNVGRAVKESLQSELGMYLDRRDVLTQGSQLAFHLYDVVYNHVRDQYIDKLIADKKLPAGNDGKKRMDLTPEQEAVVRTRVGFMTPMVHTPLSKASQDLRSGLYMGKTKRTIANQDENPEYSQRVEFATGKKGQRKGSVVELLQDPGVSTLVLMIHSSDSAISSFAAEKLSALNIHDAHGLSLVDAIQGGKNLNQATYEVMRDFSVPAEILNSLKRALDGVVKMEGELLNDPTLQKRFREMNKELYSKLSDEKKVLTEDFRSLFTKILDDLDEAAYEADRTKLENLVQTKAVNQYALEGGEWVVTEEARALTQEKLDALEKQTRGDKKGLMKDLIAMMYNNEAAEKEASEYVSQKEQKKATGAQKITQLYTAGDIAQAMGQLSGAEYTKLVKRYTVSKSLKEALDKTYRTRTEKNAAIKALWAELIKQDGTSRSIKHANKSTAYSILRNFEEIGSEFLPEKTFNDMKKVQERMEQSELDFEDAANDVLSPARASSLMSFLNKFYNSGFSYWGKLGESTLNQDQELMTWFEQKTVRTVKETVAFLAPRTDTQTGQGKFQRQLLSLLGRLAGDDLKIEYVTQDSAPLKGLHPVKLSGLTGFYSPELNTVYIKGRDFTDASVTPELVIHELVHAVTAHAIRDPKTPEAKELIKELEELRARAGKKVAELSESLTPAQRAQYEYAVSNLDEFLAHGWTDAGFQKDILMRIQKKHANRNNSLLDGLQEFLHKILNYLFKRNVNATRVRGMEIFAANSMALMKDAASRSERKVQTGLRDQILGQRAYDNVQTLTTEQVFTALNAKEAVPAAQSDRLKGLLDTVVANLHGPYGAVKAEVAKEQAVTDGDDVFLKAIQTGQMPFAAEALNGPAAFTRSEAYVLEQVEATLRASQDTGTMAYRDMVRVFRKARAETKASDLFDGDWSQATPDEKATAQEIHDFIFKLQPDQDAGRYDHMSRFGALALVYPPLVRSLQRPMDTSVEAVSSSFGDQVQYVFDKASRELSDRVNLTYNRQDMDARVKNLVSRLVDIEAKKKAELEQDVNPTFEKMEAFTEASATKLRDAVAKAAGSDRVTQSRSEVVKAMGSVTKAVAEDRVEGLLDTVQDYRNRTFKGREGVVASAITELRGEKTGNKTFYKLLRESQKHEQNRKRMIDETSQQVLESFANKGKDLTQKEKDALTPVLLRTGLSDLLGPYSLDDLTTLVNNPGRLSAEIDKVERRVLKSSRYGEYYNNQAINLAYKMATGWAAAPNLQMNAHNIANMLGTQYAGKASDTLVEQVTPEIDTLVSLNALKFTNSADRTEVGRVMNKELARGNESGVAFVLGYHKRLQEKSRAELFNNNPVQFMKGYTKEIYNPYINAVTAPTSDAEMMKKRGYVKLHKLPKDSADVNQVDESLYVIRDGGLNRRVTGIMSFTGTNRRGSAVHAGVTSLNHDDVIAGNQKKNQEIGARQAADINALFKKGNRVDPYQATNRKNHLVPVMNEQGEVANYRYLMLEKSKNKVLERTNSIDKVLGSMTASVYDKVSTAEQNTKAVQALRDQYLAERMEKPDAYIRVSPDSKDKEIRESYHLLPSDTKKAIRKIWGKEEMWVRADTYDMTFGYRKYSLSDAFDLRKAERNIAEEVLVTTMGTMFGEKASLRVAQAQDMWEAAVGMVKDIYVIKNLSTFIGNVMSNVSVLLWYGVSPKQIAKNHKVAIEGLLNYTNDRKALDNLKRTQEAGTFSGSHSEMEQQILELEHALENSPIHELVDEGMFQTIMEDIDAEDNAYSYKGAMFRKMDEKTQKVPQGFKTAAKTMLMTHDTPLYKLMYKSTQMSDFVARYTLHEHLMNRKKNPLSRDESLKKITEAFVNYDIPTSRSLQFMNDMGLVMFTKYYMRIQKVLLGLYQDHPGRALGLLTFFSIFDGIPNITESGFTTRLGDNPLGAAALDLPGAVDEILPIKAGLSLFR